MNNRTLKSFFAFLVTCLAVTLPGARAQWDANPNGVDFKPKTYSTRLGGGVYSTNRGVFFDEQTGARLGQLRNDNPYLSATLGASRIQNKLASGQQVRIILMGDSWADGGLDQYSAPFRAMEWLRARYGTAGQGMNNIYLAASLNTYWARRTTNDWKFVYSSFVGYGSDAFPWAKYAQGYFKCDTNYNVNECGLLYMAQPDGQTLWGRMFGGSPSFTVAAVSNTPTLMLKTLACNITNGAAWFEYGGAGGAGTNVVVGAYMRDTNAAGIFPIYLSHGGSYQTDILNVGTNNLARIGSLLQPDLILYMAFVNDYVDADTYSNRTTTIFNAIRSGNTNTTIMLVANPDVTSANGSSDDKWDMVKNMCSDNGYFMIDLYSYFPSGAQNMALGITDALHATNSYPWAYKLIDLMNLKGF